MDLLKKKLSRRSAIQGISGALGLFAFAPGVSRALTPPQTCQLTPKQTSGPFYPIHDQLDKDNDLTVIPNQTAAPLGQLIYIRGHVSDAKCKPVEGALVEIWQACASGRYNHPSDPNPAPLDPNFQYWGKAVTDSQGNYIFKTILPGSYPADTNWTRPPHIHFKIAKTGYIELVTQLYFADQALNVADLILKQLSPSDQKSVTVALKTPTSEFEPHALVCDFPITIKKPGT